MFQPAPLIIYRLHPQLFLLPVGLRSPRPLVQGPARGLSPAERGVPGHSGAARAGTEPQPAAAPVHTRLSSRNRAEEKAARKQPRYANAVENLTVHGAGAASLSCSRAVSTQAFSFFSPLSRI